MKRLYFATFLFCVLASTMLSACFEPEDANLPEPVIALRDEQIIGGWDLVAIKGGNAPTDKDGWKQTAPAGAFINADGSIVLERKGHLYNGNWALVDNGTSVEFGVENSPIMFPGTWRIMEYDGEVIRLATGAKEMILRRKVSNE